MAIVASGSDSVPSPSSPAKRWQDALKLAVRDPERLCQLLQLPEPDRQDAVRAAEGFPVFAPLEFIRRMRPGDPRDPLLRQVLPMAPELDRSADCTPDPVDDAAATIQPGLLQKYAGRALMVTTSRCAVHCRYCFRRHYDYDHIPRSWGAWQPALEQLANDPSLHEVVLSGGDPLMLPDRRLEALLARVAAIPHLLRLRIHTRMPIVIPQRITPSLVRILRSQRLTTIVVVHVNHPAELDWYVEQALAQLADAGLPLLNQCVLLDGVNNSLGVLVALSERLVELRVMPYYLHHCDPVLGAAHFQVPVEMGVDLIERMRGLLPGYAVPRFVREIPGQTGKTPLA